MSVLQVHVNEKRRYPAYSNSDLRLMGTDMVIELEIPEIKTEVIYTGSSFSIKLPFELFGGNTEGQCGKFRLRRQVKSTCEILQYYDGDTVLSDKMR